MMRIGSRDSKLALIQTEIVCEKLLKANSHLSPKDFDIVKIKTTGDKILHKNLNEIGGKNLFVKELEMALLQGNIDFAVHSLKDMTGKMHQDLCLAAHLEREDPRDAFISLKYKSLLELPLNAVLGTSSIRRKSIALNVRPDLEVISFRGNVQTRLAKLEENHAAATYLAMAGLKRLNIDSNIYTALDIEEFLPAVSQGIIGVQCRKNDHKIFDLLLSINHEQTAIVTKAERGFLEYLDADCSMPIAAYGSIDNKTINLKCLVVDAKGKIIKDEFASYIDDAQNIGIEAGKKLKAFI